MLAVQDASREAALAGVGELLRLTVAALGGIIVIGGILTTAGALLDGVVIFAFAASVACMLFSVFALAMILTGDGRFGRFASGPDLARVVEAITDGQLDEPGLVESLAQAMPDWIDQNTGIMHVIARRKSIALVAMAPAAVLVFAALFYIVVGGVHA